MSKVTVQTDQGAKTINFSGTPKPEDIDYVVKQNNWKPAAQKQAGFEQNLPDIIKPTSSFDVPGAVKKAKDVMMDVTKDPTAAFSPIVAAGKAALNSPAGQKTSDFLAEAPSKLFDVASWLPRKIYGGLGKIVGTVAGATGGAAGAGLGDYSVYIDPRNPMNVPAGGVQMSGGATTPGGFQESPKSFVSDTLPDIKAGAKQGAELGGKIGQTGGELYGVGKTFGAMGKVPNLAVSGSMGYQGLKQMMDPNAKPGDIVAGSINVGLSALGGYAGAKETGTVLSAENEKVLADNFGVFKKGIATTLEKSKPGFVQDPNFVKNDLFQKSITETAGEEAGKFIVKAKQYAEQKSYSILNQISENFIRLGKKDLRLEARKDTDLSKAAIPYLKYFKPLDGDAKKLDTMSEAVPKVQTQYEDLNNRLEGVLENTPNHLSMNDLRSKVIKSIETGYLADEKPLIRDKNIATANAEFDALEQSYIKNGKGLQGKDKTGAPDIAIQAADWNRIKKGQYAQGDFSFLDAASPDVAAAKEVHNTIGLTAKTMLEESYKGSKIDIKGINTDIGNLNDLKQVFLKAHGTNVKQAGMGGFLSKAALKTALTIISPGHGALAKGLEFMGANQLVEEFAAKLPYATSEQMAKLYSLSAENKEVKTVIDAAEEQVVKQRNPDFKTSAEKLQAEQKALPAGQEKQQLALPKGAGTPPTNVLPKGETPIELGGRTAKTATPAVIELPESQKTLDEVVQKLKMGEVKASELKDTVSGLEQAKKQAVKDYLDSEQGAQFQTLHEVGQESAATAEVGVNKDVVSGIQNSKNFKKEGDVTDEMGQGWLMKTPAGKTIVATADEAEQLSLKGYQKTMEIDSLAKEAGYEDGKTYLEDQLGMATESKATRLETAAHRELLKTDKNYKNLDDTISKLKDELKSWKTEKAPLEQRASAGGKNTQKAYGAIAGIQPYKDKDGKWKVKYDAKAGFAGVALMSLGTSEGGQKIIKQLDEFLVNKEITARESEAFKSLMDGGNDFKAVSKDIGMPQTKLKAVADKVLEKLGMTAEDLQGALKPSEKTLPDPFKNYPDLSTKIIGKLEGKTTVSKQFISDLTNSGDVKQVERDIIREALVNEGDKVNVAQFADKVKAELLPLKITKPSNARYEFVSLPDEIKGKVANYSEHIYQSPIKTSAGNVHFTPMGGITADEQALYRANNKIENYFGHTRIEDMVDTTKDSSQLKGTDYNAGPRRVIEVQSDLYQKGGMEKEINRTPLKSNSSIKKVEAEREIKALQESIDDPNINSVAKKDYQRRLDGWKQDLKDIEGDVLSKQKLNQYNDPTAHFRMVREEVKQAAIDGKTTLQFPTGDTAMKIEGLGDQSSENRWLFNMGDVKERDIMAADRVTPQNMKAGDVIYRPSDQGSSFDNDWVVTDVMGDGKFKAVPKNIYERANTSAFDGKRMVQDSMKESFDISGKVDTNNPIYKFYEKEVGKYLKNKYDAKLVTDDKGVTWWELPVKKEQANLPVEAFGVLPVIAGAGAKKDKQK